MNANRYEFWMHFDGCSWGRLAVVVWSAFVCTTLCQGGSDLRVLDRSLVVRPDLEAGTLEAVSSVTVSNASNEPVDTVHLILYYMLDVTGIRERHGESIRFAQRVTPMADCDKMLVNHVEIALDKPLASQAMLSLEISYNGRLAGYVETGQRYVKDHISEEFSILRLDCLAYPVVGAPSLAGLRTSVLGSLNRGWDYSLSVTVPEGYVAANGGELTDRVSEDGEVTYFYRNIKPAWRIDVCIATYGIVDNDGKAPRLFFLPGHKKAARRVHKALLASSELLSEWFGARPNLEGFSVIEVPRGYGSQADVTCILQDAEAFEGDLHYLYHEVSHLWNPPALDPAPCRFESEGLACFLEYLLQSKLENKPLVLEEGLENYRKRFRAQCEKDPRLESIAMAQYGEQDCTEASYTKGPIAFWILYEILGEELFFEVYRQFCLAYGDKGATLDDFVEAVKTNSGKDLQTYFDEWVYGAQSSEYLLGCLSMQQILQSYIVGHED